MRQIIIKFAQSANQVKIKHLSYAAVLELHVHSPLIPRLKMQGSRPGLKEEAENQGRFLFFLKNLRAFDFQCTVH